MESCRYRQLILWFGKKHLPLIGGEIVLDDHLLFVERSQSEVFHNITRCIRIIPHNICPFCAAQLIFKGFHRHAFGLFENRNVDNIVNISELARYHPSVILLHYNHLTEIQYRITNKKQRV